MKTKKKKSSEDRDLASMRDKYKQHKDREERGPGGDGEKTFYEWKAGRNLVRIMPRIGSKQFFTEAFTHFKQGPDGKRVVRCIDEGAIDEKNGRPKPNTKCPICKKFLKRQTEINSEYARGDEEGKREWRAAKEAYCPRQRYYFNMVTSDGEMMIGTAGDQIMSQLLSLFFEDDTEVGDFTDIETGRWMNINRKGSDRQTKYMVHATDKPEEFEQWEQAKEMLHDLDKACGDLLTADQVIAIMKGTAPEKEDDESDDDDDSSDDSSDDDDDEDEKPAKKGKKRPSCFGDADQHDPDDETCQECSSFEDCKLEPDVKAKHYKVHKSKKEADGAKKKLKAKSGR